MYKQSDMPPKQIPARLLLPQHNHCCSENKMMWIGHANEYPTMHHFGNPGQTQSIIAVTEYFWKLQLKLHFGNAVDIPFQNCTVWAVCNINIYHAGHFIYCGDSCTISLIVLLQQQWEGGPAIRHIFGRNVDIFMIDTSLLSLIRRGPRHILALHSCQKKRWVERHDNERLIFKLRIFQVSMFLLKTKHFQLDCIKSIQHQLSITHRQL